MGKYINRIGDNIPPAKGKADFLVFHAAAIKVNPPKEFCADLVCVVDNGPFEAAAFAYSENEMNQFLSTANGDDRPKQWLIVPDAENLAK